MLRRHHIWPLAISAALTLFPMMATAQNQAQDGVQSLPADPTLVGQTTEWKVCNNTSYVLRTASAFLRGSGMSAKGWDEIRPGGCISITTPVNGPRFLFAESSTVHQGGVREWKGTTPLCVKDEADFTSPATEDCRLSNKNERDFFAVRPGEPVTTLVEPAEYSREKSVIAAQQRLLRDSGYAITRIDGLTGRKTSRLLRTFRKDNGLAATVSGEALMSALIDAAQAAKSDVGLEVCNQSSAPIWTAVATQDETGWRSRGWWRAAPEACVKVLDRPLPGTDAHIFAEQEGGEDEADKRLRSVATSPAQFCIAESKFDAIGNEMCLEQGYVFASFRPVSTDEAGTSLRLTDADFAAQLPGGLRR